MRAPESTPVVDADRPTLPVADGRTTLGALRRAAGHHRRLTAGATALTCVAGVGVVAGPVLLGRLVDLVAAGSTAGGLVGVLIATGVVMLVTAVFTALSIRETQRLGATIAADLREEVLERSLTMPAPVLEKVGAGDVASRVTEDVENFVESVPLGALVFTSLITLVWSTIGFAVLDWRLALAFLTVFPVYSLALRWYLPRAIPLYARERRLAAARSGVLLQTLNGLDTVRAYGSGTLQTSRIEVASERTLGAGLKALGLYARFGLFMNGAEAVGLSALLFVGYLLVTAGSVTVGAVTAAALLFHRLFTPLGILLVSFDDVQRAGAALARMVGVTTVRKPVPHSDRRPAGPVAIAARALRHTYDGAHPVLLDVDVDVPAGSSLAVVGASGAGKSTLAALLGGAFPATAGTATLADRTGTVDVGSLAPEVLRDWVGIVSQETHVFSGTVRDDVTLAAPDCSDTEVGAALELVGAWPWVRALPDGLDTRIGTGGQALTSVQVQQLALARLALRNPPVIVLDEATAEAGSSGARDLLDASKALLAGRTAVVVAHRLDQAAACDRIAVMSGGRIVELGSHDELVRAGGGYADLWHAWSRH